MDRRKLTDVFTEREVWLARLRNADGNLLAARGRERSVGRRVGEKIAEFLRIFSARQYSTSGLSRVCGRGGD